MKCLPLALQETKTLSDILIQALESELNYGQILVGTRRPLPYRWKL